jgi:DNA-binding transcriptional LysR family regulator
MMDLAAVDLNLFVVLDAVLREGSVTAAARRLHVTQSAVSNALARLRALVGDPLLVRRGRGLVATPLAGELAPRIAQALAQLAGTLTQGRFDPAASTRCFTLALTDNQEVSDLPRILPRFTARLPQASLKIVTVERLVADDGLASGLVDLALGPTAVTGPGLRQRPLYREEGVLVVRRDNRKLGPRLDRATFEATPQVDVQVLGTAGVGHRMAREQLAREQLQRRVVLTVPHFMAAAIAVSRSDWLTGMPRRFAEYVRRFLPLRIVRAPFDSLEFPLAMHWHDRTDADPGAQLLREVVHAALAEPE